MGFDVYVDGTSRPARPFTAPRVVAYPAPAGPQRAYLFPFFDQVLHPRTLGGRVPFWSSYADARPSRIR